MLLFAGLTLLTGVSWVDFVDYLGELIVRFYRFSASYAQGWMHRERIAGNIDNDQMDAQFDDDIEEQIEIPEKIVKQINKKQLTNHKRHLVSHQ